MIMNISFIDGYVGDTSIAGVEPMKASSLWKYSLL
jgi:hypothetical protein